MFGLLHIYGGNYVVKFGAFVGATEHGYNIIILVIVRHIEEHDYFSEIVRELDYWGIPKAFKSWGVNNSKCKINIFTL